jgi:hypothetical protein
MTRAQAGGDDVPYRPSNGTEGEMFMSDWCFRCERDKDGDCDILARTLAFNVDDPRYPKEWVCKWAPADDGFPLPIPRCTAFCLLGEPLPTPRCDKTQDMFR